MQAGHADGMIRSLSGFVLLLLSTFSSFPVCAQVSGGTISGVVMDPSGAVIPDAKISIKNIATAFTRDVSTDAVGFYAAPNLLPGDYEVTSSALGFTTQVRTGISLSVGAQQTLNLRMQVGIVTEKVEVAGQGPAVQLTSSALSAVANSTTVRELPLNGRSWTDLATLQPGVVAVQTQPTFESSGDRGNRGFGTQVAIDGARPYQNNYRLDGVSLNDYANGAPGSVLGGDLGADAIEEFSVVTSNYSVEYGKTSGGVVNAITRSGSNQFHGNIYEFLRNSALDARNFFDTTIPPFTRNQFGASVSGPIRKDRTFIFGNYEGIRQSKGITHVDTVPSPAARAGNLSTGPVVVDPLAAKFLPLYPLPNGGLLTPGDTGIFTFAGRQIVNEDFLTTRLDQRFSDKDSLFGTYLFDQTPYTSPDSYNNLLIGSLTKRQIFVLEESHNFGPSSVNSVRLGINREFVNNEQSVKAINPLSGDPSLGAVPGRDGPLLTVSGLSDLAAGLGSFTSDFYRWTTIQAYDDAFLTKGLHALKFGVALERIDNNIIGFTNTGNFKFATLSDFLTNHPKQFSADLPQSRLHRGIRETVFGLYLQDDWRARPNLTLNLGLRYEMTTVPTEVHGQLANLITYTDAQPHLGDPYFSNPTLRNFEPRAGFAWDPFRDGKTAVHGSLGMFDVLPLPYMFNHIYNSGAPFALTGQANSLPAGSFYTGGIALAVPSGFRYTHIQHDPPRNYVGSRGVHQPFLDDDVDTVIPTLTSQGYIWPSPVGSGKVINSNAGDIRALDWGGDSLYDALQLGITKKMSHGLQVQGSYTWGKSIDTSSSSSASDAYRNTIPSLPWFNLKMSRALSDFNIGRTLAIDGTWQVPSLKSAGPVTWLTNGWELGGILKVTDGVPFTATFGSDGDPLGLNSSDPWDFPNRLTGPGCASLINPGNPNNYIKTQCFAIPTAPTAAFYTANCDPAFGTFPQCFNLRGNAGRNILTGPGTSNLDFSVFKNHHLKRISENFNVQFRAEFFNILNRANFAVPTLPDNVTIFDSTGSPVSSAGLLTSTTTTSREIQFAVKISW
jgi:Carboxypeptidase regulatory-like domain/TonB-dependent Receptor Plug Domain/TonB dependent receptor